MIKYVGIGLSMFLTISGLAIAIGGGFIPHLGMVLAGAGITIISGVAVYYSFK
jgi:hypothetical protein